MNFDSLSASTPSLTTVRNFVRNMLKQRQTKNLSRTIVYFAIDGLPYNLASKTWGEATQLFEMTSVLPTTSSSAWTSAFTGNSVSQHGVVGTVFTIESHNTPINIYETHENTLLCNTGNIFSDARGLGYLPIAFDSDLDVLDCKWKVDLLDGASVINTGGFFSNLPPSKKSLTIIKNKLKACIADALNSSTHPKFIWCFLDTDQWIHQIGYSSLIIDFLLFINEFSHELTQTGAVVIAHSDHGLVPIQKSSLIENLISEICHTYNATMGGAGRVRWFYSAHPEGKILAALKSKSADLLKVYSHQEYTSTHLITGKAARRIGKPVITPTTDLFLNEAGYNYEHGSNSSQELSIPFACWKPNHES